MEKSTTDPTTSSTSSSEVGAGSSTVIAGNSATTTTASSDTSQQSQNLQRHSHIHQNNSTKSSTATPTKNQLNNSLGCGPSSSTVKAKTLPSLDGKNCSNMVVSGSSNVNFNNITSSLKTTTLGHQSSNNTSISIINNVGTLSATASSSTSATSSTSNIASSLSSSSQMAPINLNISTTTGGNFSVSVDPQITVENLKKVIAKKLKVAKDRICLLHREKELQDGLLKENNLMDGSKIILIPNVETGLLAQRPENTVMQALESLNDSQVNDFLSGKTPLNLSMRLGDHMMLIQLQLSTVNPVNGAAHNGTNCSSSSSRQRASHHHHHHHRSNRTPATASAATKTAFGTATATTSNQNHHHHHHHHHHHGATTTNSNLTSTAASAATTAQNMTTVRKLQLDTTCQTPRSNINTSILATPHASRAAANGAATTSSSVTTSAAKKSSDLSSFLSKRDYESLQNIVKSIAMAQPATRLAQQSNTTSNTTNSVMASSSTTPTAAAISNEPAAVSSPSFPTGAQAALLEQSPIKSLSNLVSSSPIKTTAIKNIPKISNNTTSSSSNNSVALGPHTASISAISTSSLNSPEAAASSAMCQDPIAAKLTSCLCTRLNGNGLGTVNSTPHSSAKQCIETACIAQHQLQTHPLHYHNHHQQQLQLHTTRTSTSTIMTSTPNYKPTITPGSIVTALNGATTSSSLSSSSSSSLHKTANNPISRKNRHHHHHHHHHHHYHHAPSAGVQQQLSVANNQKIISTSSTSIKVLANDSGFNSGDDSSVNSTPTKSSSSNVGSISQSAIKNLNTTPPIVTAATAPLATSNSLMAASNANSTTSTTSSSTPIELDDAGIVTDSRTLAEASRNLTQTLRKLSKEVFTNKIDFSASEEAPRKSGSGAVIESMKNHGKGIYSGTFSGTLNPALQDRYGRPKRDISTVIHILNDLLSATPQYHRGARISFEAPSTSAAAAASVAAASGSTGSVHHSSRTKHLSSKHHQSSHPCVKCIKTHSASSSSPVNLQTASISNASLSTNSNSCMSSLPVCAYGECNGHYVSGKSQIIKSYPCCQQAVISTSSSAAAATTTTTSASTQVQQHQFGNSSTSNTTNGHHHHHYHHGSSHHHHHHHHHQIVDERKVCQCRYRIHSETGERERDYTCQKCAAELDNIKTKSKLDQLRLVMQQRKQKREARKLKGAPYGARVLGTTTTATASGVADSTASTLTAANGTLSTPISVATSTTAPSEVSPNHLVEEVDTAA